MVAQAFACGTSFVQPARRISSCLAFVAKRPPTSWGKWSTGNACLQPGRGLLCTILDAANTSLRRRFQNFHLHAGRLKTILNHMVKCSPRLLNRTFGALADPTRRRILEHLANGDRCVTDLARPYRMSLPAVSKHLRVLERAGLIRRQRCGRVHQLKLEAKPMEDAQQWIE